VHEEVKKTYLVWWVNEDKRTPYSSDFYVKIPLC
jgi:hypothetical protein